MAASEALRPKLPLHQRAIDEFKELFVVTAYLFVTLAALNLMKAAVLHTHGVDYTLWGTAIVKALLLAKFVALGNAMKIGRHRDDSAPLVWPILHKALAFVVLLVVLTVAEEIVVGWFHQRSLQDSLADLFGRRLAETLAGILILLLVLIPWFAFEILAEQLGERKLVRMFFVDRNALR